jgi:hypothetical protein
VVYIYISLFTYVYIYIYVHFWGDSCNSSEKVYLCEPLVGVLQRERRGLSLVILPIAKTRNICNPKPLHIVCWVRNVSFKSRQMFNSRAKWEAMPGLTFELRHCGIAALPERSARCQEVMPGLTSEFAKLGVRSLWEQRSTDQPNQTQMKMKHISKKLQICVSSTISKASLIKSSGSTFWMILSKA